MKESFDDFSKKQIENNESSSIYNFAEDELKKVIKQVYKKYEVEISQEILQATIRDIGDFVSNKISFKEARSMAVKKHIGSHGRDYWNAILSAISILYSDRRKQKHIKKEYHEEIKMKLTDKILYDMVNAEKQRGGDPQD